MATGEVTGGIHHVSTIAELDALVAAGEGKLVVVDFFAEWCGPCKAIAPRFEGWAATHHDVVFVKVDVDQADELSGKYEVSAMPTFKFLKGGEVVETVRGAREEEIEAAIKAHKVQFKTVDFGAGASAAPAIVELTRTQLEAAQQFTAVAEGATVAQAAAALASSGWEAATAIGEFFASGGSDAAPAVSCVSEAVGGGTGEPSGAMVKVQVRLGGDSRDKHVVQLDDSTTGQGLLERVSTLLPPDTDFTLRVRVTALKKDVALGPGDLAAALPALGLGKRGLVQVVPVNDDPAVIKVLKKL